MSCTYDENNASAPYDPATLHIPLPLTTKACLKTWLKSIPGGDFVPAGSSSDDSTIINGYQAALSVLHLKGGRNDIGIIVPIPGNPKGGFPKGGGILGGGASGLGSAAKTVETGAFLAALGAFILNPVRMGELIIGTILVGVGINALAKSGIKHG